MSKQSLSFLATAAILTVTAAPSFAQESAPVVMSPFDVEKDNVRVHAKAAPDAVISPEGDLDIGDQTLAVTPLQRKLLKHYYSAVLAFRGHAYETGAAGADIAAEAIALAASAIAGEDTSEANRNVNAKAKKAEATATQICADLADIRVTQKSIAEQLPTFQPYATLSADNTGRCQGK